MAYMHVRTYLCIFLHVSKFRFLDPSSAVSALVDGWAIIAESLDQPRATMYTAV